MGGGDGVEKVYGCIPHGMVAVDVEELAAGAVEAVEGRLVGINGRAARTQEVSRCADVGRRGAPRSGLYPFLKNVPQNVPFFYPFPITG